MAIDLGVSLPGTKVTVNIGGQQVTTDGDYVFMPGTSRSDEYMAYLAANGYTKGSMADRERQRLLDLAADPPSIKKSIADFYRLLNTPRRIK